ncbi:putative transporter [Fusarium keratoplasticum]|nr:putative transporter [Fusarium keratoplasticum]
MRSNTPEKDYEAPHALPIETLPEPDGEARSPLETAIRHKFDRRILPLGIMIYLVAQIDRSNMSNAVVLGLIEDTNLTGNRFNVALTLFFVTYILFEIPANLMCKYFGPRFWLSFITFGFGITTMCISFVKTYPALVVCRLLLGVFEAAAGGSIAGAFGGLLGSGLGNLPKSGMFERWRWIFLVEGLLTVVLSAFVYWLMPNSVNSASFLSASFLSAEERQVAVKRIDEENKMHVGGEDQSPWRLAVLKKALWNANTQLVSLGIMMSLLSLTSLSLFMPTLLKSMGYSSTNAQLLTVPPYVLAACVCIAASFASDHFRARGVVMLVLIPLTMVGFLLLALVPSTAVRYFALFLTTAAAFTCSPILLAWVVSNSAGPSVRAIVSAYAVGEGNVGAIIATWIYRGSGAPRYVTGHLINFGGSCLLFITVGVTTVYLKWENKIRAKGKRDHRLANATEDEKWNLGHSHPDYRYTA